MSVSVTFHLMYVQIVFSSVLIAEWALFGKELPAFFVYCLFVFLDNSRFGFEGMIWVLIANVSGHCLLVAFR